MALLNEHISHNKKVHRDPDENIWVIDHTENTISIKSTSGELVDIEIRRLCDCVPTLLKYISPDDKPLVNDIDRSYEILMMTAEVNRLRKTLEVLSKIALANIEQSKAKLEGV